MAIQKYTGNGGIKAMFEKLRSVYDFKKVVCESEDRTADDATWQLWVSDEVFIRYQGGKTHGWGDMRTELITEPFIPVVSGEDLRTWNIVKTDSGVAFFVSGQNAPLFISSTLSSAGTASVGLVSKTTSGSWRVITDGMSSSSQDPKINANIHGTYTQLCNIINPLNDLYFPNLYAAQWITTTSEQNIMIDGTKYYSNAGIALKE